MIFTRLIAALLHGPATGRRASRLRSLMQEAEALLRARDAAGAEKRLREAIAIDAGAAQAHALLALLLTGHRRMDEALPHFRAAHAAGGLTVNMLQAFVRVLIERGERLEAGEVAEAGTRAHPDSRETWLSSGLAHHASHRYSDALAAYDRALGLGAGDAELHTYRAIAAQNLGRLDEASADYERALRMQPDYTLARFHRSLALLLSGRYEAGWPEYETRLANPDALSRPRRYPRWDGAAAGSSCVLVYGEQGLGDEIMFASCLPDLMRSGTRCVVECNPALTKLFERSFPDAVVYPAAPDKRVPQHVEAQGIDAEMPLGSLPLHYRRSREDFPRHAGYLKAAPDRVAYWRARLAKLGPGVKVGISWTGGTHASRKPLRSIPLEAWLPLLRTPGLTFVSLQYTPEAAPELAALERDHGIAVAHWPEAITDYDETAALVCALELTISVCTSVVHLAGALGTPVWVLAPKNPEWRYGNAGEDMPWYPAARLFRQAREGEWSDGIHAVEGALASADTWNALGISKLGQRDFAGAQRCLTRALELNPRLAEAHTNLGIAFVEQGDDKRGEACLRQAIATDPALASARENLAVLLTGRFEHGAALSAWDEVLAVSPEHAAAHAAKAYLALREGRFDAARTLHARALELGAERAPLLMQEASMRAFEGDAEGAKRLWNELSDSVDPADLDWERAICALAEGDYAQGWPLYEARLKRRAESPRRPYRFPEWDGGPLRGGALLIMGEQGLGDEIMFAGCYAEAIERAGAAIVECEPRLERLFGRSFPRARVVPQDRSRANAALAASGEVAAQVHAGSLPRFFRRGPDAFPRHGGYLEADQARVAAWRARLRPAAGSLKPERVIGIAWSGGLMHTRRALRSIAAAQFAKLLRAPGVAFVSLQHDDDGSGAAELSALAGVTVDARSANWSDIDETAALVKSLDGVLTVCSSVVHLAGALGTPALVLTPALSEWRYLREGATLPWYPSVRLIRQKEPGAWDDVIEEAREKLAGLASGGALFS